jgi:hypothetical protein
MAATTSARQPRSRAAAHDHRDDLSRHEQPSTGTTLQAVLTQGVKPSAVEEDQSVEAANVEEARHEPALWLVPIATSL